mmetsp:Transcript_37231/g.71397  ORF Transcript_37231/g.71397 Transcript_37231/m.71397 type:complete len:202 (-) Transcript_37231:687-1292(-)
MGWAVVGSASLQSTISSAGAAPSTVSPSTSAGSVCASGRAAGSLGMGTGALRRGRVGAASSSSSSSKSVLHSSALVSGSSGCSSASSTSGWERRPKRMARRRRSHVHSSSRNMHVAMEASSTITEMGHDLLCSVLDLDLRGDTVHCSPDQPSAHSHCPKRHCPLPLQLLRCSQCSAGTPAAATSTHARQHWACAEGTGKCP